MGFARRRCSALALAVLGAAGSLAALAACSLDSLSREFENDASAAPSTEGGSTLDASSDSASGAQRCADIVPPPLFCDDFDRAPELGGWADRTQDNGGALRVDGTDAVTTPGSLLVTIPPTTGPSPLAFVSKASPGPVSRATLSFFIKTDDLGREPARSPSCVLETSGHMLRFLLASPSLLNEIAFGTGGITSSNDSPPTSLGVPAGKWTHVAVTLTLSPSPRAVVTIGGVVATDMPLVGVWPRNVVTARVGVYYAETPTNGWTARFDNVVFDAVDSP